MTSFSPFSFGFFYQLAFYLHLIFKTKLQKMNPLDERSHSHQFCGVNAVFDLTVCTNCGLDVSDMRSALYTHDDYEVNRDATEFSKLNEEQVFGISNKHNLSKESKNVYKFIPSQMMLDISRCSNISDVVQKASQESGICIPFRSESPFLNFFS